MYDTYCNSIISRATRNVEKNANNNPNYNTFCNNINIYIRVRLQYIHDIYTAVYAVLKCRYSQKKKHRLHESKSERSH